MASQEEEPALSPQTEAFVTLVTQDSYALGACVLGHSLRRANTTRDLVVLITNKVSSLA